MIRRISEWFANRFSTVKRVVLKNPMMLFFGLILLIAGASLFVQTRYLNHMEEIILAKPLRYSNGSVSVQDYSSGYEAISTATGNLISAVAAFLTLILLTFQFYEIKDSKKRYREDKRQLKIESEKNEIHRFIDMINAKIDTLKFGSEKVRTGTDAIIKASEVCTNAIEERQALQRNSKNSKEGVHQNKFELFSVDFIAIMELSSCLLRNSSRFEPEMKMYLKDVFMLSCEYKYHDFANKLLVWTKIQLGDEEIMHARIHNSVRRYQKFRQKSNLYESESEFEPK